MTPSTRYLKQFIWAMAAHVLLVTATIMIVATLVSHPTSRQGIVDTPLRFLIILVPVIPVIVAMRAFSRAVGELDELQRRIQLEAFAFSLGGTVLLTFGYGFLEYAGLPHLNWFFVPPVIVTLWVTGVVLANRRYR
jgi:hypothetical protein